MATFRISAGSLKGYQLQSCPRKGTKIRSLYDLFLSNPLKPISCVEIYSTGNIRHSRWYIMRGILQDYGLDIRSYTRGFYWLVGQYTENGYVDFFTFKKINHSF